MNLIPSSGTDPDPTRVMDFIVDDVPTRGGGRVAAMDGPDLVTICVVGYTQVSDGDTSLIGSNKRHCGGIGTIKDHPISDPDELVTRLGMLNTLVGVGPALETKIVPLALALTNVCKFCPGVTRTPVQATAASGPTGPIGPMMTPGPGGTKIEGGNCALPRSLNSNEMTKKERNKNTSAIMPLSSG